MRRIEKVSFKKTVHVFVVSSHQHFLSAQDADALLRSVGRTAVYAVNGFHVGIHDRSLHTSHSAEVRLGDGVHRLCVVRPDIERVSH